MSAMCSDGIVEAAYLFVRISGRSSHVAKLRSEFDTGIVYCFCCRWALHDDRSS